MGSVKESVPNFLLRKPSRPFNPYVGWNTYADKQIVFQYDEPIMRWDAHPRGVIIESHKAELSVNGNETALRTPIEGSDFMWYGHCKGFLARRGNTFLLNDADLLYEGEWDDWRSHPEGVVIYKEHTLYLNGGGDVLYTGDLEAWEWDGHLEGVIVQYQDQILLNGKTQLYKGEFDTWLAHPRGVIVQQGNRLILNTQKVVYEGEITEWASHPDGVIMKKDNLWIFYAL
ncbi:hypothetical protein A2853_01550 [Candidatus Kaiserbacteria bacterium RIFCSPHIGHO2_01_FULL_55_17]|uniref:Uncharacterized protein n=1 Tax=Candidatus Kaiserbacteria bacterium RIFCSPHIGHO2_01_FULL_55_17 TaxID=1798484 RepID=A0A1F6D7W5_9BACT|nr:MAG: hypothetical protein A2853_01550 [Candidatus Kaiserbacteria bacterium RIFCSPHIGHO2_01_FULL_55_17]